MISVIKYTTIVISAATMLFMAATGFSGGDTAFTIGVILFYTAILVLLQYSSDKNYKPGYWIAFCLAMLPVAGLLVLLIIFSGVQC
jgi:hypothetical protein